ncbi:MAG: CRISPR-associated protein Cas4 [Spirosomataceae bacterium]
MTINATLINYFFLCHRKLWLHYHGIRMEHTSDVVYEGKLIGEESYPQRAEKNQEVEVSASLTVQPPNQAPVEVELSAKIDFFDAKQGVVHEIKRSDARERAHIAQVQFYLFLLRANGIRAEYGLLEYPKLRQTERVYLSENDTKALHEQIGAIWQLLNQEQCPPRLSKSQCKSCSYFEFCWVAED